MKIDSELNITFVDGRIWRLHHDFTIGDWTIPAGFETDLASIPRFFWRIFPPTGRWAPAAVMHDYLYRKCLVERKEADRQFMEAMKELGVSLLQRTVIYFAVRMFGWLYWKKDLK